MDTRFCDKASPIWIPCVNMVRKIEGPDVEPPTQTYLSRDQDPPSPHTSDFVLGRKVYFMPIFKPVPQNYSLETAAETCHAAAIRVLASFQKMDSYWEERLTEMDKTERHYIISGLRHNFPLIITDRDTECRALIAEPEGKFLQRVKHPRGHGMMADDTYDYGVIKLDDHILLELEEQSRVGETCGRDYSILGRSVRNVRVLTAVVFYTLAFQLADILASQNYFGSDYGERPDTGLSKNRHPIEGRSLEKTLFDGDLELWMNKEKEYKLVVNREGELWVLDSAAACGPFYPALTEDIGPLDMYGPTILRHATDTPDVALDHQFAKVYHAARQMRFDRWHWEQAWNHCREGVPKTRFSVKPKSAVRPSKKLPLSMTASGPDSGE